MLDINKAKIIARQGYVIRSDNTLHGFTKARMVQLVRDLESKWAAALSVCENQYKMLNDMYGKNAWHDLRKNPFDLPEGEGQVLVCMHGVWAGIGYHKATESAYYIPGAAFFTEKDKNKLVIAWRPIPLFEEGTE